MFDYDFNDYDKNGLTPLYFMVSTNNLDCVKKILEKNYFRIKSRGR